MGLDDMAKKLLAAAAKKALASAVHNIRKGASKHYCPVTRKNKHSMVRADLGGGWYGLHCDDCSWFDPKNAHHTGHAGR
jgi:hypothetical protein